MRELKLEGMGLLNASASQTIEVQKDLNTTVNLLQKALQQIGTHTDTKHLSFDKIAVKGNSRYGLQGIPLEIFLQKINDSRTKVVITGKSDDIAGVGAKKCIERLLTAYQTYSSGDIEEIQYMDSAPAFQKQTGFTKKRLFLYVIGFIILLSIIMNANKDGANSSKSNSPTPIGKAYFGVGVRSNYYTKMEISLDEDNKCYYSKFIYNRYDVVTSTILTEGTYTIENNTIYCNLYNGQTMVFTYDAEEETVKDQNGDTYYLDDPSKDK